MNKSQTLKFNFFQQKHRWEKIKKSKTKRLDRDTKRTSSHLDCRAALLMVAGAQFTRAPTQTAQGRMVTWIQWRRKGKKGKNHKVKHAVSCPLYSVLCSCVAQDPTWTGAASKRRSCQLFTRLEDGDFRRSGFQIRAQCKSLAFSPEVALQFFMFFTWKPGWDGGRRGV